MIDLKKRKACPDWTPLARELAKRDPALKNVIDRVGPCTLCPRRDYFAALCQSIVSQQISTKAAISVYKRFRGLFPGRRPVPGALLTFDDETLRSAGISRQKAAYLRSLAEAFESGAVPVRKLPRMTDEEVIEALVPIKGIGRWTAEMFLIFVLAREDVFPVDDLGLQTGIQKLLGLPERVRGRDLIPYGERWRPYRSIATWYLWRGHDNFPDPTRDMAAKIK